jgi:cephalosporin-C deacetylase-like acetyl esterase
MFLLKGTVYRRRDIELVNEQGYVLKCSWYLHEANTGRMPCVVYCHGNCGNRLESFDAVENLLPMGISVFSFDFAGSGLSEGSYISLGYYESMDVKTIVDFLRLT